MPEYEGTQASIIKLGNQAINALNCLVSSRYPGVLDPVQNRMDFNTDPDSIVDALHILKVAGRFHARPLGRYIYGENHVDDLPSGMNERFETFVTTGQGHLEPSDLEGDGLAAWTKFFKYYDQVTALPSKYQTAFPSMPDGKISQMELTTSEFFGKWATPYLREFKGPQENRKRLHDAMMHP